MPASNQQNLVPRPPVVVVMGHIDHGKSTLLDYIRKSNIVAGEAGGITQHVGAYQVEHTTAEGKKSLITFLDTPGHEAFCSIRERGAQAADVAILIVSAEDGVKPQTLEAYKNIKESKLPYVVAITKIDKPNANIDRTKQSLGENEIYVEGWGGDVPVVPISSVTGQGISELLDMVMLVSDLANPSARSDMPANGAVIESTLDKRKGITSTLIIKNGNLEIGTFVVAGASYTPVRYIENFKGEKVDLAIPSMPVRIVGWNIIPECGIPFTTVDTKKEAEKISQTFMNNQKLEATAKIRNTAPKEKKLAQTEKEPGMSEDPVVEEVQVVSLPLVIKADVIGSLDGVKHELAKITHDKVQIKIVNEGIGEINENDVKLAQGDPEIIIIGFNVNPDKKAAATIERLAINVRLFTVIYELTDFVRTTLLAKVPKEYIEEMTGRAQILALFSKEKDKQVIGGKVETGTINTGNDVRIMRRQSEIGRGKIRELQTKKVRTSEVAEGHEFGMLVEAKVEIAPGDRIEAVRTVEK